MTDVVTPTATRLKPPSWRDSRLLIGVLLLLVSTALGAWVVRHADDTVPLYAAKGDLVPGEAITADNVVVVDAQLGTGAAAYLSASADPPRDARALRGLRAGELIPQSAVGQAAEVKVQAVTLQADTTSSTGLTKGSVVDVYVNVPKEGSNAGRAVFAGPEKVLSAVDVETVDTNSSVLGSSSGTRAVQIMVPTERVQDIVKAVDDGAKITLVPVPGSPGGAS